MDKKLLNQLDKEDLAKLENLRKNKIDLDKNHADLDFRLKIQQQNLKISEYRKKIAELELENAILTMRLEYGLTDSDIVNEKGQILKKK